MYGRKIKLSVLLLFVTVFAFSQPEALKPVVNNLAQYKAKKELKYLAAAKKSIDSLITTHADSADTRKLMYRALVNSTIVFADTLNTLKQPADLFKKTVDLADQLIASKKTDNFPDELEYIKRCIANVYIRSGFQFMGRSDFANAEQAFRHAQKYQPSFTVLNFYLAYSSNKLGNLQDAAKYYTYLIDAKNVKPEYIEAAASIYTSIGDTTKALQIIQKGRALFPDDILLLLDEANIYNSLKEYTTLQPLLAPLLETYPNNADIAFIAANCYDHINQYNKAENYYLQAVELNSSSFDAIFNLALLYLKEGAVKPLDKQKDTDRAIQLLKKADEIAPDDIRTLEVLQLVYTETQNKNQLINVNNKLRQLTNQ